MKKLYLCMISFTFFTASSLLSMDHRSKDRITHILNHIMPAHHELPITLSHEPVAVQSQQTLPHATVWEKLAKLGTGALDAKAKKALFIEQCKHLADENNKIPHHTLGDSTIRIATYNVHMWKPLQGDYFSTAYEIIKQLHADIIILQEAQFSHTLTKTEIFRRFKKLGYTHMVFSYADKNLANIVLTKNTVFIESWKTQRFANNYYVSTRIHENRSFAKVNYILPNNKKITLYGTHLEVWDTSGRINEQQAAELIKQSAQENNVIIAADYNAVRKKDYQYIIQRKLLWNLVQAEDNARTSPTITQSLDLLEKSEFVDCFTKAGKNVPRFTAWSGTIVDFLMLKNWNLPITWCGVMYTAASDHLPIIMDVKI